MLLFQALYILYLQLYLNALSTRGEDFHYPGEINDPFKPM